MKITELLNKNGIVMDLKSTDKPSVIRELATVMEKEGIVRDIDGFMADIHEREKQGSTGVGFGVAIPHAKSKSVKKPGLVFGRSKAPIKYESHEEDAADIFFMIAAPEGEENIHLQTLAKLSRTLIDEGFRDQLREATSAEDVLSLLSGIDTE